jgi:hypothetical protein
VRIVREARVLEGRFGGGREVREPDVVPMDASPFAFEVRGAERHMRMRAVPRDLVTDELGFLVAFRSEDDVEALLNDPRFGAMAMNTTHCHSQPVRRASSSASTTTTTRSRSGPSR